LVDKLTLTSQTTPHHWRHR